MNAITKYRVTPGHVWEQMNKDSFFTGEEKYFRHLMRCYIEYSPLVLLDLLECNADLVNMMNTRLRFINYCLEDGVLRAIDEKAPKEGLGLIPREKISLAMKNHIDERAQESCVLAVSTGLLPNLRGKSEKEIYTSHEVGMNVRTFNRYKKGGMTIGVLLRIQPGIFLNIR